MKLEEEMESELSCVFLSKTVKLFSSKTVCQKYNACVRKDAFYGSEF